MINVLTGKIECPNLVIIDCRFPFEFEGGHIKGAKNFYLPEQVEDYFFKNEKKDLTIIVHCEFSQKRGPKMFRSIREKDRCLNLANYPKLTFPNLFLLEGGYSKFYNEICK
jgi:hypothetical protein